MLQQESKVYVGNNCGLKQVRVIRIYGKRKVRQARIGDRVIVTVPKATSDFKKGQMLQALVVNTCFPLRRKDGSSFTFKKNVVLIVKKEREGLGVLGTRINVPIPLEILPKVLRKVRSLINFVV